MRERTRPTILVVLFLQISLLLCTAGFVLTKKAEHFDRYLGPGPRLTAPSSDEVTGGQS